MKSILPGLVILIALTCWQDGSPAEAISADARAPVVSCGRACLESAIERYLQALAARDPSRIAVTDDIVFSENNQILELGDGSWKTFSAAGTYRHYFADPQAQQVAVISTMRENGQGVIYDLRLRLQGDRISEIESMVIRSPGGAAKYEELGAPPPNFRDIIPVDERNSREELLAIPRKYLKGMENNDPDGDYSFFDPECNRYEHAVKTTNSEPKHVGHTESTTFSTMTCEAQFSGGGLAFVTRIRDERYHSTMVVDEEKQAVFGFVFLDHDGTVRYTTRPDGTRVKIPPYFSTPRSLQVGEAWRVRDNRLFEIEMTLTEIPYGMRPQFLPDHATPGWQVSADLKPGNLHIDSGCERNCLEAISTGFLEALLRHDYEGLPLSPDVRYRENGVTLAVGDGLWGTVTELGSYKLLVNNPDNGEAGVFTTVTETDVPGLVSARLRVEGGQIQDIDVTVMRHEYNGSRGGTLSLFYPQIAGMFDPQQFTGMETELGMPGGANPDDMVARVSAIRAEARDSVILVADAANGLVLQNSIRDVVNAAARQANPGTSGSYSVLTTTLYKFAGKDLLLSKSVSKPVPYRMP